MHFLLFKTDYYILILVIIFSNLIFFYLNFKGQIFLGDNGTLLMAYILSHLIVREYNLGHIKNSLEIVVLMCFPVADLVRLFFIRLIKNKHPFSGDKTHIHHLLLRKIGLLKTNICISICIILPVAAMTINIYLALILSVFLYSCLIIYAKKIV